MTQWFYADSHRQRQGPVQQQTLVEHFHDGVIALDTLVWREGMGHWQPLGDFAPELHLLDLAPSPGPASLAIPGHASTETNEYRADEPPAPSESEPYPPAPATAGRAVFTANEPSYAQYVPAAATAAAEPVMDSPYAPPVAPVSSHHDTVVAGAQVVYAGFWKRVAANFIDSLIIGMVGAVLGAIIGGIMGAAFGFNGGLGNSGLLSQVVTNLVSIAVTAFYYAWFHSSANLATLGKMAIGIKVVRSHGEPISFLRGIGRYFGFVLGSLLLGIGLLMAAFTERKQALHDLMCDTLVVDKWAFTRHPERQREELGTVALVVLIIGGLLTIGAVLLVLLGLFALMGAVR